MRRTAGCELRPKMLPMDDDCLRPAHTSTQTSKVCKIMALMAVYYGIRAIILHTFGV